MGWVSKLRFFNLLNTWNAEWIFPYKHCYDYSSQMDLPNSTSLLQALLIWLASAAFSSWKALYCSSPSYPKPAHALDNHLKSYSTKILNRWTNHWIHRTKVFFLPFCKWTLWLLPPAHTSILCSPIYGNSHRIWVRLSPSLFPWVGSMPMGIISSLLTESLIQVI